MADDDKRDDKLLVLPLGEESKLITQTIANDTARQILELLADGALSTSAIAKKLDIPLTTAQYNVEKLIEAKLVVVEKTKYSEKGREVKMYAPAKRMIVLVPANTPRHAVMDVLKRYLVLVPIAGFVALLVELAMQFSTGTLSASLPKSAEDTGPLMSQGVNLTSSGSPTGDAAGWLSGAPSPTPMPLPTPVPAAASTAVPVAVPGSSPFPSPMPAPTMFPAVHLPFQTWECLASITSRPLSTRRRRRSFR
jgi:DNA-binding transcriptional ArsR family regulator